MNEILNNISSISWWFGVIFVGVLVSLGAGYLKPYTDNWLASHSKSKKNKNDKERLEWASEVSRLKFNENYKTLFISRITHVHGRCTFFMLWGISMFLLSITLSLLLQLSYIDLSVESNKDTIFFLSFPKEKILYAFMLLTTLAGGTSLLLGINYSKSSEKLQQQLEDSFEQISKEEKFDT